MNNKYERIYNNSNDLQLINFTNGDKIVNNILKDILNNKDINNIHSIEYTGDNIQSINISDFKCIYYNDNKKIIDKLDIYEYDKDRLSIIDNISNNNYCNDKEIFNSYKNKYTINFSNNSNNSNNS